MSLADEVMRNHNFAVRMDVERQELGKAIREANYDRAASIAAHILEQIQVQRQELQEGH